MDNVGEVGAPSNRSCSSARCNMEIVDDLQVKRSSSSRIGPGSLLARGCQAAVYFQKHVSTQTSENRTLIAVYKNVLIVTLIKLIV